MKDIKPEVATNFLRNTRKSFEDFREEILMQISEKQLEQQQQEEDEEEMREHLEMMNLAQGYSPVSSMDQIPVTLSPVLTTPPPSPSAIVNLNSTILQLPRGSIRSSRKANVADSM